VYQSQSRTKRGLKQLRRASCIEITIKTRNTIAIFKIQVFGDCSLVINWITSESRMTNLVLNPIFDEIKSSLLVFNSVCFERVHREFNGKK
jgi:hypothetical protein